MINSQSAAAVNSASKSIVNALKKSLKKINKVENSDNPMFSGWIKVKEDVRIVVWAGRCYDAETKTYSFSGTFTLESKNHRDEYTNDVDCLVGVTSTDRLSDDQCIALIIDEFKKKLSYWMGSEYEILSRNAYIIDYCYFGGAKKEAPALEEAPVLEEDNDITEEGYSVAGLAYVKENNSEVSMADIIRAVAEEHWDFESVVKESQWTRFTNDSFRDLIWSTCWAEYLVGHTDEALEAETRYIMNFDSVYDDLFGDLWPYMSTYDDSCGGCELWVDAWYVVERAAEIIEESVADSDTRCIDWDRFPDYMIAAFLDDDLYGFDTFTERVMSELEGGDIVDILPYDDGLHFSFVNDEAEVAA